MINHVFINTIINFSSEYIEKCTQFNYNRINELNANKEFMNSLTSAQIFSSVVL